MNKKILFSVSIKDCKVEVMRTSKGAGGQKRDKTSSATRVTHVPSGAVGFSQEHREQHKNKALAFRKMAESPQFQSWCRLKSLDLPAIDDIVNKMMDEKHLKVETKETGRWKRVE